MLNTISFRARVKQRHRKHEKTQRSNTGITQPTHTKSSYVYWSMAPMRIFRVRFPRLFWLLKKRSRPSRSRCGDCRPSWRTCLRIDWPGGSALAPKPESNLCILPTDVRTENCFFADYNGFSHLSHEKLKTFGRGAESNPASLERVALCLEGSPCTYPIVGIRLDPKYHGLSPPRRIGFGEFRQCNLFFVFFCFVF